MIASQALITGAFTMVSEATRLNWMPHLQVRYPARTRGQLYIPVVNGVLCVSTLAVLAIFKDSEHISAAYGLALTITMITTTVLLGVHLWHSGKRVGAIVFTVLFLAIQAMFFIASMAKFLHGGWFTMLLTAAILFVMYTWNEAPSSNVRNAVTCGPTTSYPRSTSCTVISASRILRTTSCT